MARAVEVIDGTADDDLSAHLQIQRQAEEEGQVVLSLLFLWRWWSLRKEKAAARHQALRHLAVVAHALYTGSTSAYALTPDLPRMQDSTRIYMGSSEGYAKEA